ncbi:MAG: ATP-binding protein [Bacteroidota bacterium]
MQNKKIDTNIRRIALVGAESTGKTTLTKALAAHFQTAWNPEFVRGFAKAKMQFSERELSKNDLDTIFWGQLVTENQTCRRAKPPFVFFDTNLLMSIVYARYYQNVEKDWWEEAFQAQNYHHYFLLEPDFPWQPDPVRESPEAQATLQEAIHQELIKRGIAFTLLSGSLTERLEKGIEVLKAR